MYVQPLTTSWVQLVCVYLEADFCLENLRSAWVARPALDLDRLFRPFRLSAQVENMLFISSSVRF